LLTEDTPTALEETPMTIRQPRPKAFCDACGAVSTYTEHINRHCVSVLNPGDEEPVRCEGVFRAAVDARDWAECSACRGTGMRDDKPCGQCDGAGWLHRGRVAAHHA
jgi:DnaJ-class molecular chaperone